MEALKALKTRRSIRKYSDRKISDADIKEILTCAMYSPSAFDKQPWHFIVINRKDLFDKILETGAHADMIKDASHVIIICGDNKIEDNAELLIQDLSAVTENVLLAAHALGLGSVWVGIYPFQDVEKKINKLFKMPENILPVSIAVLGYPAEEPPQPDRYRKDRVHINKW